MHLLRRFGSLFALAVFAVSAVSQPRAQAPAVAATAARAATSAPADAPPAIPLERIHGRPPLEGSVPRAAQLSPGGRFVSYLAPSAADSDVLELWLRPLPTGDARRLASAAELAGDTAAAPTEAERMALERRRILHRGITEYRWCGQRDTRIVVALGGDLHLIEIDGARVSFRRLSFDADKAERDPTCDRSGEQIAFVKRHDLWMQRLDDGPARRLRSSGSDTVSTGLADFIAAEEFNRFDGSWWSRDGRRLLAIEVDDSGVASKSRMKISAEGSEMTQQRYPAAGERNARVQAVVIDLASGRTDRLALPPQALGRHPRRPARTRRPAAVGQAVAAVVQRAQRSPPAVAAGPRRRWPAPADRRSRAGRRGRLCHCAADRLHRPAPARAGAGPVHGRPRRPGRHVAGERLALAHRESRRRLRAAAGSRVRLGASAAAGVAGTGRCHGRRAAGRQRAGPVVAGDRAGRRGARPAGCRRHDAAERVLHAAAAAIVEPGRPRGHRVRVRRAGPQPGRLVLAPAGAAVRALAGPGLRCAAGRDNVLFEHSLRLIQALQIEGKLFEPVIYPRQTHGLGDRRLRLHADRSTTDFFVRHLRPRPPAVNPATGMAIAPKLRMTPALSPLLAAPRLGPAVLPPAAATGESAVAPPPGAEAVQRVVKVRRDYNSWVARETMEDYALRFTPRSFRKWSELRVANTAFGAASFLVLEAVGATLLVAYGFTNAFWAILATGLIIFMAGLPISVYAARHGVDMDLLTRGAGFGYIGSTVTSLIYASFTFIFFALEAAIMAYALELAFDVPPAWGYLICALAVIPLVTHGVTVISRLQVWTQPLWIVLLVVPYVYVFDRNPGLIGELTRYAGADGKATGFDLQLFGAAMTVGIALITQMGEQADYLRFMPERTAKTRIRWWAGVLIGGPGWVVLGVVKMLGGALLAYLAISHAVPVDRAVDPNQMYLAAYEYVFPRQTWAIAATALLVVVSQLKINVTNAYAGSLAWSNFFARLTHSHPGRVVWVVFNTAIALMLMELDVFQALGKVLGLYSNIAISWMMAVVADLVVNKPLGLSPKGIEFKRAHLYDINPVGVGAMGLASVLSITAYLGWLGPMAQAFSALIALVVAFVAAPLIAWATGGRYYLARLPAAALAAAADAGAKHCTVCEREYETDDMAYCPAYLGHICSLCCSLDARCNDMCKPAASWSAQWQAAARWLLPRQLWRRLDSELGRYLLLTAAILPLLGALFYFIHQQQLQQFGGSHDVLQGALVERLRQNLSAGFVKAFAALAVVTAIVTWWLVLTHKSRQVAQEESNRQTHALNEQAQALRREIESHRRTDEALQQAKQQADLANQAKTRYISAISHELRTPLNSIIGYAQLLEEDDAIPAHRRQAVSVIRRGGDHLLSLIEGTLDIARIEAGKLSLDVRPMRFPECLQQVVRLFELQAAAKGIEFWHAFGDGLPQVVRSDEGRLRQILINVLGNAVKFTREGRVVFRVQHTRDMATFEIEDTGPGISPLELERVFEPFARGAAAAGTASSAAGIASATGTRRDALRAGAAAPDAAATVEAATTPVGGTGLGLTISKMLTDLIGGEMTVSSTLGAGTVFRIRLFLPEVHDAVAAREMPRTLRVGYSGVRRRLLVVDNEEVDRELLARLLTPLGFEVRQAASGPECLAALRESSPDAVLMDLAMPGMDGWETMRTIRREQLSDAPFAVVSANAFEKGADNDLGLVAADFIVKPVRRAELLDWLGRTLALHWLEAPPTSTADGLAATAAAPDVPPLVPPDAASLRALQGMIDLGYLRGIVRQLDDIEAREPASAAFVRHLRELARQFQLDAMTGVIRKAMGA